MKRSDRFLSNALRRGIFFLLLASLGSAGIASAAPQGFLASDGPANPDLLPSSPLVDFKSGHQVSRIETFANEGFWTDAVRMPKGVLEVRVTPLQALQLGLSVDIEALDAATRKFLAEPLKANPDGKPMKLGQQTDITPVDTASVEKLKKKGAGELAARLEGSAFEQAYGDATVKDHTEALSMTDDHLLKAAKNGALKKHLTETRAHIAIHLEKARQLHGRMER